MTRRWPWSEQMTGPIVLGATLVALVAAGTLRSCAGDDAHPAPAAAPATSVVVAPTTTMPPTTTTWFDPLGCDDLRPACVPLLPHQLTIDAKRIIGHDGAHLHPGRATEVAAQLLASWPQDICTARVLREAGERGAVERLVVVFGGDRGAPLVDCKATT